MTFLTFMSWVIMVYPEYREYAQSYCDEVHMGVNQDLSNIHVYLTISKSRTGESIPYA